MYCLHNETQCPHGQLIHTSHNSIIRCGEIEIPILSAHNTQDGIPRATAPRTCLFRKGEPEPELIIRIIEAEPSIAAKWGPTKKSKSRTLSIEQVIDIRKRYRKGESQNKIAKIHGVHQSLIRQVVTYQTYRDVKDVG